MTLTGSVCHGRRAGLTFEKFRVSENSQIMNRDVREKTGGVTSGSL